MLIDVEFYRSALWLLRLAVANECVYCLLPPKLLGQLTKNLKFSSVAMNVPRVTNSKADLRSSKGKINFFQTIRQGDRHWNSEKLINRTCYETASSFPHGSSSWMGAFDQNSILQAEESFKKRNDLASTSDQIGFQNESSRVNYGNNFPSSKISSPSLPYNPHDYEKDKYATPTKRLKTNDQEYNMMLTDSDESSEINNLDFFNLGQLLKPNSSSSVEKSSESKLRANPSSETPSISPNPFRSCINSKSSDDETFHTPEPIKDNFTSQKFASLEIQNFKTTQKTVQNYFDQKGKEEQAFSGFFPKPSLDFVNEFKANFLSGKNCTASKSDSKSNVSGPTQFVNPFGSVGKSDLLSTSSSNSIQSKFPFKPKEGEPFFKTPHVLGNPTSYDDFFDSSVSSKQLPQLSTPLFQTNSECATPKSKVSSSKSKANTKASKVTATSDGSFVVISITEGRGCATGEVGIALIDLKNPILTLCQLSDYQTYTKTLTKLHIHDPAEIIIPDTFENPNYTSDLLKRLSNYFGSVRLVKVKRQFFSGPMGMEALRSLSLPEYSSVEIITMRKFYALAAMSALIKYVEYEHNVFFCSKSVKIVYECASGTVSLDLETAKRLELVLAQGEMVHPEKYSLFGTLNNTVTMGGKRRLRTEILQPFSSLEVIEERLNIVSYLINDRPFLSSVQAVLEKFSNVERLLWLCKKPPNFKQEQKTSELLTSYILILKNTLESVPLLRDLLSEAQDDFFINIRDMLCDKRLEEMKQSIQKVIHPDAKPGKGYQATEMNRCFSIKDNINGLLDVARSTYSKLINEVQEMIDQLASEHNLPLKMSQTADFGFHAILCLTKKDDASTMNIPEIFTDVKQKGNTLHISTDEIFSYNARIRRAVQEIQIISNIVLNELIEDLKPLVGCLYVLCEKIAELDVVCCLAKVSCCNDFIRPTFGQVLDVKAGRHPILDFHQSTKPIPNDIFASINKNFNIITGPNMGGKTVYALQVAILQIMAQIGCFVPADSASFRLTDHIYVRKGGLDNIEFRGSNFTIELKEITYAINTLSETSLIVMDEICTGTSHEAGTALAWGLSEEFLKRPVFTFLTTHFHYLTNLERIFNNVTNYHLEAIDPGGNQALTFTYRLQKGVTDLTNYGIKVMLTTSLPESLKQNAIKITEDMCRKRANSLAVAKIMSPEKLKIIEKVDKLERFMEDLYRLTLTDEFTVENVQKLQLRAREEIVLGEEDNKSLQNE